jgi:hypothetical protein
MEKWLKINPDKIKSENFKNKIEQISGCHEGVLWSQHTN